MANKKEKAKQQVAPPHQQGRVTREQAPEIESADATVVSSSPQHQPLMQFCSPSSAGVRISKLVIAAGTYEGVVAGWEWAEEEGSSASARSSPSRRLKIRFASPVHSGSVRSLSLKSSGAAATPEVHQSSSLSPGLLVSCGYDDRLSLHDFAKSVMGCGEVRTPTEWGTPVASAWAPPVGKATHCLVGFSGGPLVLYSSKDWSIQHVMRGHGASNATNPSSSSTPSNDATAPSTVGISSLAVHPSGKLALTGGTADGKLMLWDLTKGRLAHVTKVAAAAATGGAASKSRLHRHCESIVSIVWGSDPYGAEVYAFAHGSHVTVRDVATGGELLDVELPSRVNQIGLLSNPHGLFAVAACNDGSLPVLAVRLRRTDSGDDDSDDAQERRAIMAIEPVSASDTAVAGEERFKCLQVVSPYHVVTANSAGVVSLMSLQGAVRMLLADDEDGDEKENGKDPKGADDSEADSDGEGEEEEEELAVDIVDSVRLGTGARITCLAAWSHWGDGEGESPAPSAAATEPERLPPTSKRSREGDDSDDDAKAAVSDRHRHRSATSKQPPKAVAMDTKSLETARKLVEKAKEIQQKKHRKKHKTKE